MTSLQAIVGHHEYIVRRSETAGDRLGTIKAMGDAEGPVADEMAAIQKLAVIFGRTSLDKKMSGYTNAVFVPRVPGAAIQAGKGIALFRHADHRTFSGLVKFTHDLFDLSAVTAYAISFFRDSQVFAQAGAFFDAIADSADVVSYGRDLVFSSRHLTLAKKEWNLESNPLLADIADAIETKMNYSALKLMKAVAAFTAGIFACYAILTGLFLVSPAVAVIVSLASTIFNLSASYYKNISASILEDVKSLL